MVYQGESLQLNSVQMILDNDVNTITVCRDSRSNVQNNYTVIELKDHEISKKLITGFYMDRDQEKSPLITTFSSGGNLILVFPYVKVRPLSDFYIGDKLSLQQCEKICNNLVLDCITGGLPYPVLYLILKQKLIDLNASGDVYFHYFVDFKDFDGQADEKMCVVECAKILLELLKPHADDKKMISYILLQKRVASSGYTHFTELYKDITMAAAGSKKRGLLARFFDMLSNNKDRIFKVLLWISIILLIIVILSFITQAIFGDIPWLRFFSGCFRIIGTESMRQ